MKFLENLLLKVNNCDSEWTSNGPQKAQFYFSSSFPPEALDIFNPWSPNLFSESVRSILPSAPEWGRTGNINTKAKPQPPSRQEWYLFRLQPGRDPGVLLQGTAWVVIWGRVPLEVKHEFADGLLHLQGHHRHHVLLLRALAVQTDLPASSKGGRWEGRQKIPFFSIGLPAPSPWIPKHKHIPWQLPFGKSI